MDSVFITSALNSTFEVFKTMAHFKPTPGIPILKDEERNYGDITAIMEMRGDRASGQLAISFSRKAICDIAQRMLNEEHTSINETTRDLTGELVNMIVGGTKRTLSEQGYEFDMSTPDIVVGQGNQNKSEFNGETVSLPFETPAGKFYLELTYDVPVEEESYKQASH